MAGIGTIQWRTPACSVILDCRHRRMPTHRIPLPPRDRLLLRGDGHRLCGARRIGFGAAAALPLLALVIPLKILVPAWTLIALVAGTA